MHMPMVPFGDTSTRTYLHGGAIGLGQIGQVENEINVVTSPALSGPEGLVADQNEEADKRQTENVEVKQEEPERNKPEIVKQHQRTGSTEELDRQQQELIKEDSGSNGEEEQGSQASRSRRGSQSPVQSNRELHNEIERRRRLRIKQCCDVLRTLVPGLSDKTDKATVLEHTVKFVSHLVNCPGFKCNCDTRR